MARENQSKKVRATAILFVAPSVTLRPHREDAAGIKPGPQIQFSTPHNPKGGMIMDRDREPAFPTNWTQQMWRGMDLRDYFATKAISLFPLTQDNLKDLESGISPNHALVAKFCYGLADAMLAERAK